MTRSDYWTEADVAALLELHASDECTREQIAEYIGRSFESIKQKIRQLRRAGVISYEMTKHKTPFRLSPNGILIARSCVACGKLRDASYYKRDTRGSTITRCLFCVRSASAASARNSPSRTVRERLNEVTRAKAFNEGQRYSDDEIANLHDAERNDLDLALTLGRSYYAIWNKRLKLGLKPTGAKWRKIPDSHWAIEFPAAMAALQEHFRALGEPVPESLWEWTDDEKVSA